MQNYRFRKLIVSIATCFLLAVALLFLLTEQAYAAGIENGFGASSDKEQIESFAAVYGWDPSLFLKKLQRRQVRAPKRIPDAGTERQLCCGLQSTDVQ